MKTRLIQIGNSRGVRLPKPLIEEAGLTNEVELEVRNHSLVIRPVDTVRRGWADAARAVAASRERGLLDAPSPTRFDDVEWRW